MEYMHQGQLRFRVVDQEVLSDIIAWAVERLSSGYDVHWDSRCGFVLWICVPGDSDSLGQFLSCWGRHVSGDTPIFGS